MKTFIIVLLIAILAYGIFRHAILNPDVESSWNILFEVLFPPYLLTYGDIGIEKRRRECNCGNPLAIVSNEILANQTLIYYQRRCNKISDSAQNFGEPAVQSCENG